MFLDRLAIAGLAWTARTALSLGRTRKPSTATRKPSRRAEERRASPEEEQMEPAETQLVVAPDQDLLEALNIEESMGYQGGRR